MLPFLNSAVFGPILPVFLCLSGFFFMLKLRLFPISHPILFLKGLFSKEKNARPLRGMLTALAGTLGVGNITGVAAAITAGGPGAVFWMWISAIFAMFVKYAETLLACLFRKKDEYGRLHGGSFFTIRYGLGKPLLSSIFAFLLLLSTYFVGNFTQTFAAAETAEWMFSCPRPLCGAFFSAVLFLIISGGAKRIGDFAVSVIPILTGIFIVMSFAILYINRASLPALFHLILRDAFTPTAGISGILGYLTMRSLRIGTARGIFSNEAGCGTSPTAHAANAGTEPAEQGMFGILEVFTDTVFLCTLTALVVLLSIDDLPGIDGTELAVLAFESGLGKIPAVILGFSVLVYALASTVAWAYYGSEALAFLGGKKKADRIYRLLYSFSCFAGAIIPSALLWDLSDLFVSLLTLLNTGCVLCLAGKVKEETRGYIQRRGTIPSHPQTSETRESTSPHSQRIAPVK